MKAVYEMPKVSCEAFMANNAVSTCVITPTLFDCVNHGNRTDDIYKEEDCEPAGNVVANVLGMSGCSYNAGFADLVDKKSNGNDTQTTTDNVWGLSDGLKNDQNIMNSTTNPVLQQGQSLLGWLYITFVGGSYKTGKDSGWKISDNKLRFKADSWDGLWDAWITPLLGTKSTSI